MKKHLMRTMVAALALSFGAAQAAVIDFTLGGAGGDGLLGSNEVGNIPANPGSGGIVLGGIQYDTVTQMLTINVGWGSGNGFTDLSGAALAAHIHGPADENSNAGVLYNLGALLTSSASNGGISGMVAISPGPNEAALLSGNTYLNVHTAANGGGEIRGQLRTVPEPETLALLGLGLVGLALRRRRSQG